MKTTRIYGLIALVLFFLGGCASTQSLQEYYVDNAENPNFLSIDVPASILKLDDADLTPNQRKALESLRKLNVLAFKRTEENELEYLAEKAKVNAILKNESYVELMKIKTGEGRGVIKYLGTEEYIHEVVIYGNSDARGFALVRILGKDMKPSYMVELLNAIQKSDYKGEGLGEIGEFLKS